MTSLNRIIQTILLAPSFLLASPGSDVTFRAVTSSGDPVQFDVVARFKSRWTEKTVVFRGECRIQLPYADYQVDISSLSSARMPITQTLYLYEPRRLVVVGLSLVPNGLILRRGGSEGIWSVSGRLSDSSSARRTVRVVGLFLRFIEDVPVDSQGRFVFDIKFEGEYELFAISHGHIVAQREFEVGMTTGDVDLGLVGGP